VEPLRDVWRPRDMWRIAACLSLLAIASTGCIGSSFQGDCSGGEAHGNHCVPFTPEQKAALAVEGMPIPPRNGAPLINVDCSIAADVASCDGTDHTGRRLHADFKVEQGGVRPGYLTPICPGAKHPDRPTSVYCTQ
jgi:hypothetical protein